MKQVTIDTVRERIAELEMVHRHGELSLRGEFELACLRMLADSMGGVDDDVRSVVSLLESNEWAEHCTKTEIGQRLESEITRLVGHVQPVPVTEWEEGSEPPAFGKYYVRYMTDTGPRFCIAEWLEYDCCVPNRHMVKMWLADHSRSMNALQGVTHFTRLPEWSEPQEPATDNTAQQFEALATIGKSEHLLNAERIAREAKVLSDRLNATSEVNPRVSGWSERQQKVISYSLWRFMHTAYELASQAGQRGTKADFDRFMQEAKDAEEIREEFTSAGSGKP